MVDNATDEPDWMVDVTGRVSGDYDYSVTTAMLTITDDNAAPGGDLALAPASIREKGGTSTATISAVNNDADELDRMVTGTLANSQGAGAVTGTTLTDDDTRGVTLSGSTLTVQENMMGTSTVVLDSSPVEGAVTATSADAVVATVNTGGSPASRGLVFTAGNWATSQTVTVTGTDNPDSSNAKVQVTHSVTGAVAVTVTENDRPGLRVSLTQLMVEEEGATASYSVRLNT